MQACQPSVTGLWYRVEGHTARKPWAILHLEVPLLPSCEVVEGVPSNPLDPLGSHSQRALAPAQELPLRGSGMRPPTRPLASSTVTCSGKDTTLNAHISGGFLHRFLLTRRAGPGPAWASSGQPRRRWVLQSAQHAAGVLKPNTLRQPLAFGTRVQQGEAGTSYAAAALQT